jgi:glycosyltransferase involved in cell wall biosynthesis
VGVNSCRWNAGLTSRTAKPMDKVRILFLAGVDADNTNAQSLNVREIVLRLDPERFDSTVLYERDPDARLKNRSAIRLLQLPARNKTFWLLREMLADYDIVAYMDYSPASYAFLHLPRTVRRAKAVMHVEAPSSQLTNPSRLLRRLYDGVQSRCDVYTAITEFVAQELQCSTQKRAKYILPVGVDTSLFSPPLQRANLAPVVLFAGTLIERKGPQYMIDAAARFPGARFRLVGAGRGGFEESLRQKIAEAGLKNVALDGPKTQLQLLEIMRASDIFLLPSRLEGIPKVTLEAAATGLPCIVFRDYETPSVVDGVTGFQVATPEGMMQVLAKLIADPGLRQRMGTAGREHTTSFDWDLVSRQWQSAYLDIAGSR